MNDRQMAQEILLQAGGYMPAVVQGYAAEEVIEYLMGSCSTPEQAYTQLAKYGLTQEQIDSLKAYEQSFKKHHGKS
jgi:hypothetical protein